MKSNRNYGLLLSGQFLSAFGDNAILAIILGPLLTQFKTGQITPHQQQMANIIYTSLLFIPYVLLAPLAGYFNDRFAKNRWLIGGNLIKLAGTGLAAMGIFDGHVWLATGYFIVGIGACVYSPAKYGILPEILPLERLVKANGTMELLTLVAILTGMISGAALFDHLPLLTCYLAVMGIYAASMALNFLMSPTPSYPEVHLRGSTGEFFKNAKDLLHSRRLARVLMGTSVFWICGAMMKMNFQPWGQQVLKLNTALEISLLGLWLSIGVMCGSVLAGQLYAVGDLRGTRLWGWSLAGLVAILGAVNWLMSHGLVYPKAFSIFILIIAGLAAGLFLIPLNAALQSESHKDKLGKTIATQNGFENLAMLTGSAMAAISVNFRLDPSELFLGLAGFVCLVTFWLKIPTKPSLQTTEHFEPGNVAR